jgi:hypothetical protein
MDKERASVPREPYPLGIRTGKHKYAYNLQTDCSCLAKILVCSPLSVRAVKVWNHPVRLPESQTKSSARSGCSPRSGRLASCQKEEAAASPRKGTVSLFGRRQQRARRRKDAAVAHIGGTTRRRRALEERHDGGTCQRNDAAAVVIGERSRPPSTTTRETSIEAENSLGWVVMRKEETNGDAASHYQHVREPLAPNYQIAYGVRPRQRRRILKEPQMPRPASAT